MKILGVELQGFGPYHATQSLRFADLTPGLYHVAGNNKVNPRLEGNGVGKSKLFESIFWCLFGKTSRNLRASAVAGWFTKEDCIVAVEVQRRGMNIQVIRAWAPNILAVSIDGAEPKPIAQEELEKLLGIDAETFLFSFYHAQFTDKFLDLKPAAQLNLYSRVTGLDFWERASDFANRAARDTTETLQTAKETVSNIEGQLQQAQSSSSYKKESEAWNKQHRKRGQEIENEIEALQKEQKTMAVIDLSLQKQKRAMEQAAKVAQSAAACTTEAAYARNAAMQQYERTEKARVGRCPACGQTVTKQHLEKELARLRTEVETAEREHKTRKKEQEKVNKELNKVEDWKEKVTATRFAIQSLAQQVQAAQRRKQQVEEEQNPFVIRQQEVEAKIQALKKALKNAKQQQTQLEKEEAELSYWGRGFKDLRLYMIRESLTQLNIEVNKSLYAIGLPDWGLEFDVERETKGGSVSRGFTTVVYAPGVDFGVPWEAWSGGESQRLRVAGSAGMANLICACLGIITNIELWDEPSTWLSDTGIEDLLDVLADRAETENKVILLADHRVLSHGRFAGTITITKTENGSIISAS